ncbi:MAG: hypothetical protein KatS3mg073_0867 [Meiothermus sp.]|nr:MAG: hypothetical protein KatS3mg073_0867 [Meiothermus sp.]
MSREALAALFWPDANTAKLAGGAVTTAKIANNAVTSTKIANDTINNTNQVAAGSLELNDLRHVEIQGVSFAPLTIPAHSYVARNTGAIATPTQIGDLLVTIPDFNITIRRIPN